VLFYYFPIGDSWDFRNNLWGPAHLLTHNQNPYQIKLLFPDSNAVWLPPVIGAFFFLGFLSFDVARVLWLLLSFVAFFVACVLILYPIKSPKEFIWLVLLAIFPSTIVNFTMGQFSILSLSLMLLLTKAGNQMPDWIKGLIIALLFSKPQLIIFSVPVFIFHFFKENGVKATVYQIVWIIIWILISSLPLFITSPKWIYQLIDNLKENTNWLQPNLFSLLVQQFDISPLISILLLIMGLWYCIRHSIRHNIYDSIILSMAITTLLSPFIWSWDFVLLFPLLVNSYKKNISKGIKLIILVGYLAITVIFITLKIFGYYSDELFIWVVPSTLILLLLANMLQNKLYSFSNRFL
jgi:hypothetical protein